MLALKIVDGLRRNIEGNGGRYSGGMAPNLQSISDVLALPDALLDHQVALIAVTHPAYVVNDAEADALAAYWGGDSAPFDALPCPAPAPLFMFRTWSGSYVEPARWPLAALGWLRYWFR